MCDCCLGVRVLGSVLAAAGGFVERIVCQLGFEVGFHRVQIVVGRGVECERVGFECCFRRCCKGKGGSRGEGCRRG